MKTDRDARSNFVSPAGIALLAGLFIICSYFRITVLAQFLLLMLFIAVLALLWGRGALKKLTMESEGESCRVFPGDEIRFSLKISNGKLLPLIWLTVEMPEPDTEFFRPEGGFFQKFTWILPWQTLTWESRCEAVGRGVYRLDQILAGSGDGFGLSVDSRKICFSNPLLFVVYPEVFQVNAGSLMRQTADLSQGNRGYEEDVTHLKGSRAYQAGDNSRRINWRVLARQGELVVNLYEQVHPRQATFLLDLKSFTRWREERVNDSTVQVLDEFHREAMEEMISLTASLILAFAELSVGCALALPGDKDLPGRLTEASGDEVVPVLLTELAAIRYHGEDWHLPRAELLRSAHRLGQIFVLTESPGSLTCQIILDALPEHRVCLLSHAPAEDHPIYRIRDLASLRRGEGPDLGS